MDRLEANFSSEYYLVTLPYSTGVSFFDPASISSEDTSFAYGAFVRVTTNVSPYSMTVFCVADPDHVIPSLSNPANDEVYVHDGYDWRALTFSSEVSKSEGRVVGLLVGDMFADDWVLGSRELVDNLTGEAGKANFAVASTLSEGQREHLAAKGFTVQSMTGIIDFLGESVGQIQDDMVFVLLPSAFVIAVLSYAFIGSETSDRRHDIGILKTVGAGRASILRMLLSNALFISVWGGVLGLAFGIVMSYAISTVASSMVTSVFVLSIDPLVLLLAFASTIAAGVTGALIPSLRMTTSSPVSDLREGLA